MDNVVIPPYGREVLVGNWMDRRYTIDEKSNGILPGLSAVDNCEKHLSVSQESFTDAAHKDENRKTFFAEVRQSRMRNFFEGSLSNVLFMDDVTLNENFTSTNTLFYDLLPKLSREMRAKTKERESKGIPEPKQQLDMLQSYGNLTKTNSIAQKSKQSARLEKAIRMRSIYDTTYNHYPKTKMNFFL